MMSPELVLIAGMGRSGTSAMTRLLSLCGASLPPNLVPAAPDNPRGFWEPLESVALNDRFLERKNSSWYDPSLAGVRIDNEEALSAEVIAFLRRSFGNKSVVVLKEPRILSVFELWLRALETAGFTVKIVHVFRHPDEVVSSLKARDGLLPEHAQVLWLKYNLASERYTRRLPRMFISYAEILADPEAAASRCILELKLSLTLSDSVRTEIRNFIDPALQHQRAVSSGLNLVDPTPNHWIGRTYAALNGAARAGLAEVSEFDDIFDSADRLQRFFQAADHGYDLWKFSGQK